ncbi:MAG: 4'-phosphopantetheinyl transferase family protein [Oscillospiraceae bacterium]
MDIILLKYPENTPWISLEGLLGCLTPARRNGVLKKKTERDKINVLLSRLLMLSEIESRTGIKQAKLEFTHGAHGKPYIKNSHLQFSLSHTGNAICLAFSEDGEIGVDIERRSRTLNPEHFKRVLCAEELAALENGESFIRFWVQKEAFLKRLGLGISRDLRGVNTLTLPNTAVTEHGDYYIGVSGKEINKNEKVQIREIELSSLLDRYIKRLGA